MALMFRQMADRQDDTGPAADSANSLIRIGGPSVLPTPRYRAENSPAASAFVSRPVTTDSVFVRACVKHLGGNVRITDSCDRKTKEEKLLGRTESRWRDLIKTEIY
jgi:hypothetical protein